MTPDQPQHERAQCTEDCIIDGCDKPRKSRGLCSMHIMRVKRHGDPHICLRRKDLTPRQRFDMNWMPVTESGCWLWTGGQSSSDGKKSYGSIRLRIGGEKPRTVNAHKLAWLLYRGPIENGLCVLHKCDVHSCVNPNHLYLGTCKDNIRDLMERGPYSSPPHYVGESHPHAKLTEKNVKDIRAAPVFISQELLAKRFSVSQTTISAILRRRTWKHVA